MVLEVVADVGVVGFVEGVLQGVAEVVLEVVAEVVASEAEEDHRTICDILSVLLILPCDFKMHWKLKNQDLDARFWTFLEHF